MVTSSHYKNDRISRTSFVRDDFCRRAEVRYCISQSLLYVAVVMSCQDKCGGVILYVVCRVVVMSYLKVA